MSYEVRSAITGTVWLLLLFVAEIAYEMKGCLWFKVHTIQRMDLYEYVSALCKVLLKNAHSLRNYSENITGV